MDYRLIDNIFWLGNYACMHVWKEKKERNTSWKKMDRTPKYTKIQNLFGLKTERKKTKTV